ncbi:hypothetical protein P8A18_27250 [Streptomyces castrisilvae]|uniref:Uncharacterized protein n=1 Tax=Streptomyces castrisilvae TaxID=3033811 RepID=A0ABY9HTX6_9ACTN|nr:hypothetical protein [Streptomyces sp. Mut1]WLQ36901.1 hypothetical protein P8A18_27250 [Streptomyces sp. Mut1]
MRPACERLGLTFLRADELAGAGLPRDQVLRLFAEADVVIATLDGPDAELSFGLGMRHALGRRTVHVVDGTSHFAGFGTMHRMSVSSLRGDADSARQQLIDVLAEETQRARAASALPTTAVARHSPGVTEEDTGDGPGLFDLIVEAESQMEALGSNVADVEAAITDLGEVTGVVMEDMARVSHPGASMSARMAVLNRLAKAIDGPVEDLEVAAERFAERMGVSFAAFKAFLEWASSTPRSEWPDDAEELLDQVATADWDVQSTAASFQEGMALINALGVASRNLRSPSRRIIQSFQTIFQSTAVVAELQAMAAALKES